MPEDYSDEESKVGAYADYYTTIPQIQMNYYSMLDMFEKYSVIKIKNKENKNLKILIQVRIQKLYNMLRLYKSIQDNKNTILFRDLKHDKKTETRLNNIFRLISEFQTNYKVMGDITMAQCVEAITKAHFSLGLSDIEKRKYSPGEAMQSYG